MSRCGERSAWHAAGGAAHAGAYRPTNPRASPLWQCARRHAKELRDAGRLRCALEEQAIERFIECGDPSHTTPHLLRVRITIAAMHFRLT